MKIIRFPLSISVIGLLSVLAPVQYASASELVTNCVQVTGVNGVDSDSTPDNKADSLAIADAVDANPPQNEDDESCIKVLIPFDYGDAPDDPDQSAPEPDYPTLAVSQGARHQLGTDVFLGQCVDSDLGDSAQDGEDDDNTASSPSWGDCTQSNDEDGVVFGDLLVGERNVQVTVTASKACKLNAWVDWDADGSWTGVTEYIFSDQDLVAGANELTLDVPTLAVTGETYARFRCSTAGNDGITGEAADGEVEDYKVTILPGIPKVPMSLGNYIWLDENRDGLQSSDESGLTGAQVSLLNVDGTPVRDLDGIFVPAQTVTASGEYQFTRLLEGDYIVAVVPPEGYVPTSGGFDVDQNDSNEDNNCLVTADGIRTLPVTLAAGTEPDAGIDGDDANSNMTVDCGFHQSTVLRYSIGNQIWLDTGGAVEANANNGVKDSGEARATQAIGVELLNSTDDVLQRITAVDGYYLFSDLDAGDYRVCLPADNFASGGVVEGYISSFIGDEADPNLDIDGNDNGSNDTTEGVCSGLVTLGGKNEPLNESPVASGIAGNDGLGTPDDQSNLTVDFALIPPAEPVIPVYVGDYIWNDLNEDGRQDDNEPGLSGVVVRLFNADGSIPQDLNGQTVTSQTTDNTGKYLFNQLPEGDYLLRLVPPTDYLLTQGGADADTDVSNTDSNCITAGAGIETSPFTLASGTEPDTATDGDGTHGNLTLDCGFYLPKTVKLSLGNYVWLDEDADGFQDNEEKGLSGVTVSLADMAGNVVNDVYGKPVAPQATDNTGLYRFVDLAEGDYVVYMSPPAEHYLSAGGADADDSDSNTDSNCFAGDDGLIQTHPVTLAENAEPVQTIDGDDTNGNLTVDCGFYQSMRVASTIWEDLNANGQQDAGEPGLPDMTVTLHGTEADEPVYDVNQQLVGPVVTDSTGSYDFDHLVPGEYSISVQPPEAGYQLSPGGADPDDNASDSDSNCVETAAGQYQTPFFKLLPLSTKRSITAVDCGFYRPVGVGSRIWIDLDSNGLQGNDEPGVPQAVVTLLTADGEPAVDLSGDVVKPQLTGSNGDYFFGNLREGDYIIQVTPPAGYEPTQASGDPDDNNAQDSNGSIVNNGTVSSSPITLSWGSEPENDGDGDKSTNLTVGFGFTASKAVQESVQIPTASTWALGLLSMLLSAIVFWRRREMQH
ncbi:MAG: SdrD B-like domain-containing protein [Thiolinea sp.]